MQQFSKSDKQINTDKSKLILDNLLGWILVMGAVFGWWSISQAISDLVMPGPIEVGKTLVELFIDPIFLDDILISTIRVIGSVIISVVLGMILALLPQSYPITEIIIQERIKPFLNSFPSVGWAILAVIWFGSSNFSVMFVQVAILTPFCLVNLTEGLKDLDQEIIEMGNSFSRNKYKIFFKITLPLLLPYIIAAIRIAYGVCWKIALVSELFGAEDGIGVIMLRAQTTANASMVFASCFAIVIIFMLGEKLIINPLAKLAEPK
jgi:NitT/TauT family transport system permease protein/sulfonate transport system permease protein